MAASTQTRDPVISSALLTDLPSNVTTILEEFVGELLRVARDEVQSIVLFGSAAEGRLRATSDVNLLVILEKVSLEQLDQMRLALRTGAAAVALAVMFLQADELAQASEAFAVKFSDIRERHRVLYGASLLESIQSSREASIRRLRQVLLNLTLRLRERYAMDGDREEVLTRLLADITGPVRASAAVLLSLQDGGHRQPKAALEEFCAANRWREALDALSAVHRGETLKSGAVRNLFGDVMHILEKLNTAANMLS